MPPYGTFLSSRSVPVKAFEMAAILRQCMHAYGWDPDDKYLPSSGEVAGWLHIIRYLYYYYGNRVATCTYVPRVEVLSTQHSRACIKFTSHVSC